MQTIDISIDREGKVTAHVQGVKGPSCDDVIKWLRELGQVESETRTPDYFQRLVQVGTVQTGR